MGGSHSLMDTKLNLTLQSREAYKLHLKRLKEEQEERMKIKSAIECNNPEAARLHASNSILKRNEAMKFLEFKSRLDILTAQIESAICTEKLTDELNKALPQLNKLLKTKKVDSVDAIRDFYKVFQDMEVRDSYMRRTTEREWSSLTPSPEVDSLIAKIADEYELELGDLLERVPTMNLKKNQGFYQSPL